MPTMILPSEENTEYTDGLNFLIDRKVKHRAVFGYIPEPFHELWLQSTLKRCVSKTRKVIFDPDEPFCCAVQSDVRPITKLLVGVEQVVKDQFEILFAPSTSNNTIA
jgi:hypothetical protein